MSRPRTFILVSLLLGGIAWASGCGDGTTAPPAEPPLPATITVSPVTSAMTALGETLQLDAEVRDQNGRAMTGVRVNWTSGSGTVATVTETGLVTAQGNGTATITATAGTLSATAEVSVAQEVAGADVSPRDATVSAGDTLRLAAQATDANGYAVSDIDFAWSSSDPSVATVDESGLVRGIVLGTVTITATSTEAQASAQIRVAHQDRSALVALYDATGGPGWLESDGWMSDQPIGQWHGVTTGPDGRVTALDLRSSGLTGPIPQKLARLSGLEILDLRYNELFGEVPAELGDLTNLVSLRLRWNDLTGSIPPELSNLSNLSTLDVAYNRLTDPIPSALLRLGRLRLFHFASNPGLCASESPVFAQWMVRVGVAIGPLCSQPDRQILASLYEVAAGEDWTRSDGWLGDGPLSEWDGLSVDSLGRVATLDLSNNGLTGRLPWTLAELTSMTSLLADGNEHLAGPLPLSLSALPLRELRIRQTGLCIPPDAEFGDWLATIPSREGTDTECEPISDRGILEALYRETDGADWDESGGWLSDRPLGEWYGVETDSQGRVVSLNLHRNRLAGRIPPRLGDLERLRELNLGWNRLSGPVPPRLARLSSLQELDLSVNRLRGSIPAELSTLTDLAVLHLNNNSLSGPIPRELGNLTRLSSLTLNRNGFSGSIPPELGNLIRLRELDLSRNGLTGPIPSTLRNLSDISDFRLAANNLTGPLPSWVASLQGLGALHFGDNDLTGSIPAGLGGRSQLWLLNLSDNQLTGPIPSQLGNPDSNLWHLDLGNNQLSGPFPPQLLRLSQLVSLRLGANQLTGTLPSEWDGMTRLERLDLAGNAALSGELGQSLTSLGSMEHLQLSGTRVCAPDDAGFQSWLSGLKVARVRSCKVGARSSAYLTQVVQSLYFPVPLIADKEALLRVFVTAARPTSERIPKVRATFFIDGGAVHTVEIPGSATPIPTEVQDAENSLANSANVTIPGSVIQPGLEMAIEIDPDGVLDPQLGVSDRIPETGRASIRVEPLPVLDMTAIPFQWVSDPDSSVIHRVEAMAANPDTHEVLEDARLMLPVSDIFVTAHAAVTTSTNSSSSILRQTGLIRHMEGGTGYYVGLIARRIAGGVLGLASQGHPIAYSVAEPRVLAHELGHNMGLFHAPCGLSFGTDPDYPRVDGSIGAWGYDPRGSGSLVPPHTSDFMSYCRAPHWISDYNYNIALNHRLATEKSSSRLARAVERAPTRSLILWGGEDGEGNPFLDPAFVTDAPPTMPPFGGAYQLTGRDADGRELFSLGLDMIEVADGDEGSLFVVALPVQAEWATELESITLSGPGGSVTTDRTADDSLVVLRDRDSGQVRGILRGDDAMDLIGAAADAYGPTVPGLEVLFSRGVPDPADWLP